MLVKELCAKLSEGRLSLLEKDRLMGKYNVRKEFYKYTRGMSVHAPSGFLYINDVKVGAWIPAKNAFIPVAAHADKLCEDVKKEVAHA